MAEFSENERLREEEARRMEAFGEELRARMRRVEQEIEQEFTRFLERLIGEHTVRAEAALARLSASSSSMISHPEITEIAAEGIGGLAEDWAGQGSGALLGGALGGVLHSVLGTLARGGRLRPRAILDAGARGAARSFEAGTIPRSSGGIVASSDASGDRMRLSRSQMSHEFSRHLTHARRNG
jgi:hypothetical protein